ncbi:MAG TPA: hypothetical protein VG452_04225 [Egibacteraceae bacterium]|nr:hypothetical protein [Egibacteraceae bacterium]
MRLGPVAAVAVAAVVTLAACGRGGADPVCDSSYPDTCIFPPPPRLTCADIAHRDFRVLPPDPHGFDPDGDGLGCEPADPG